MKNLFQIIHIIGAIQGLFLFFLLMIRKENKLANKLLAVFVLLLTIHLTTSFMHTNNDSIVDLQAFNRSDMFVLFYGPLIAFYTASLTGIKQRLNPKNIIHLLPGMIMIVLLLISYIFNKNKLFYDIWNSESHITLRVWYIIHTLTLIHLFIYLVYGLIIIHMYKGKLKSFFSQSGRIYLVWLRWLLGSTLFIWAIGGIQFYFNSFGNSEGVLQWIISLSAVLTVYAIAYFTIKQPDILCDLKQIQDIEDKIQNSHSVSDIPQKNNERYKRNRLSEDEEKNNLDLLLTCVTENKLYLEPKLNLQQLSEEVGIPAHQISMLLSIYLGQNFYDFINKYRLEEVKRRLLEENKNLDNILTIAFEAGFNSKSTFNSVFKKFEGITPSKYRTQAKSNKT